jgi:uncharacterized protein (TIGR00299 family) protein
VRVAYIDCFSGFSGDMALGALVDLGLSAEALRAALAPLGLGERFDLRFEKVRRGSFSATKALVEVRERPEHRTLYDIEQIIERAGLSSGVAARARDAFRRLAEAEAKVHGTSIAEVFFHEVGAIDAIVDICGSVAGLALLGVEAVFSSEVVVGRGTIRSAHGEIPAPAPATLFLLEGVPVRAREVAHELTTPTGAALLRTLAKGFGPIPSMTLRAVGIGAGDADFATHPNICRILVGDEAEKGAPEVCFVLEANLDDLSPELVASAIEACFREGALDAFTVPAHMKKGRPGLVFTALCREEDAPRIEEAIFRETTTFGIRRRRCERTVLGREIVEVETFFGPIEVKIGRLHGKILTAQPEFESARRAAEAKGAPIRAVYEAAIAAAAKLLR